MLKPPAIHGGKNTDVQSFSGTDAAGSTLYEFFAQAKTLEAEKCTRMSDHRPDRMSGGSILAMFCRKATLEAEKCTRMSDHKPDRMSGGSILAMFCRKAKLEAEKCTRMYIFQRVTKVLFR